MIKGVNNHQKVIIIMLNRVMEECKHSFCKLLITSEQIFTRPLHDFFSFLPTICFYHFSIELIIIECITFSFTQPKHRICFFIQRVDLSITESGNTSFSCTISAFRPGNIETITQIFPKPQYSRIFIPLSLDITICSIFNDSLFNVLKF